jgi:hypothetical protein
MQRVVILLAVEAALQVNGEFMTSGSRHWTESLVTHFQRGLLAAILLLAGMVFWPLLVVGGLIAWSVYNDIKDEPDRKRREAEFRSASKGQFVYKHRSLTPFGAEV